MFISLVYLSVIDQAIHLSWMNSVLSVGKFTGSNGRRSKEEAMDSSLIIMQCFSVELVETKPPDNVISL